VESKIRVVHVSPRVQAHGGIEALLLHHRDMALPQGYVALVDRRPGEWPNYTNLNFNWRTPLGRMRRDFARALAAYPDSVVVYHNAWCLPLLHSGDRARRRVAACLASPAFHGRDLPGSDGLVDGAYGITTQFDEAWPSLLPSMPRERGVAIPLPIEPPANLVPQRAPGELVFGHCGRVVREQKRLDRLPEFLRELDATGLRYRFEVLGDGPLRPELQRVLGDQVRFHGWTDKKTFWDIIAKWDAVVFFTELEGGPIAMLEGMAAGAIPFYPQIEGSVGDVYAPRVDALCYYAPGDMKELASRVHRIFSQPEPARAPLRARAQALVANHTVADYVNSFGQFIDKVERLPRISVTDPARPRWYDVLPLGLVTRTMPQLLWRR
jgi:glycosyltransferase involved in cell wall biosynthesis